MNEVIGTKYTVKEITAKEGGAIVKQFHYSKKVVSNSKLHLGVFENETGRLVGCLQYGYPMNGAKTSTKISDDLRMYELNRMVLEDDQPRNSESMAIGLCNKWLKRFSDISWVLSFSDGKESNVGYIYQATNWDYLGYMVSDSFYCLDGVYKHSVTVRHNFKEKHPLRDTHTTDQIVCMNFEDVSKVKCKQHIYAFKIRKNVKFKFENKPYPKLETETPILSKKTLKQSGVVLDKPKVENYFEGVLDACF